LGTLDLRHVRQDPGSLFRQGNRPAPDADPLGAKSVEFVGQPDGAGGPKGLAHSGRVSLSVHSTR